MSTNDVPNADGEDASVYRVRDTYPTEPAVPGDSPVAKISRRKAQLETLLQQLRDDMHAGRAMGAASEILGAQLAELEFALETLGGGT